MDTESSRKSNLLQDYIIPVTIIHLFFLILLHPVLDASFHLVDDHEIIRFSADAALNPVFGESPAWAPPISREFIMFERELSLGRFRPAYYISRFIASDILGTNAQAWHIYKLLLGVWTVFLLYISSRTLGVTRSISIIFVAFFAIQGESMEIWYRLGPAETLGMFIIASAIYILIRTSHKPHLTLNDFIAVALLVIAGWVKESFILIMPALILFRVFLAIYHNEGESPVQIFRRLIPLYVVSGFFFVLQLGFVIVEVRTSYAGISGQSFSVTQWANLTSSLAPRNLFFIPSLVSLIITAWHWRNERPKRLWLWVSLIFIVSLWIIPQYVLYSNGFRPRYIYPVIIGLILINIIPLISAQAFMPRLTFIFIVPLISIYVIYYGSQGFNNASEFSAETKILDNTITTVSSNVEDNEYIVFGNDPRGGYEKVISSAVFLGYYGIDLPIALYDLPVSENYSYSIDGTFENYYLANTITAEQAKIIINYVPDALFDANPPDWFNTDIYTRHDIVQEYPTISWDLIIPSLTTNTSILTTYIRND